MTTRYAMDAIRRNKTTLQNILSADRQHILDKVFEKKLITKREYNNLKDINKENTEGHVINLLDRIMNKGEDTCQAFINLLQTDEGIKDTFPDLKSIQWDNTSPSSKQPLSNPDSAPRDSLNPALIGSNPAPNPILSEGAPVQESKRRKEDDQYQFTSTPIGLCVIINNETFVDGTSRDGTNMDADSLAVVFSWLGFKVLLCKDQTMDQMDKALNVLASFKDLPELQKCNVKEWSGSEFTDLKEYPHHGDAFVCCFLSHGLSGVVMGIDLLPLPINKIISHFNGANCPALISKPKMFFIQACQGTSWQHGVLVDCADLQVDANAGVYIPVEADFLVAIATVDNCEAFRHRKEGSWFIQSLCRELKEGCQRGDDIMAILYRVNYEVSQKEGKIVPGTAKQMPEATKVTLRKRLVLSPPEDNPPQETVA